MIEVQVLPPRGVPGDGGTAKTTANLMLQGPGTQVHHIWGLIDPHCAVC